MQKLRYCGSEVDIHVGDVVRMKRFLGRAVTGTVCYVPGECAPHPEFEIDGLSYCGIELETQTVISWPYLPGELAAPKSVIFVSRGDPATAALPPDKELL